MTHTLRLDAKVPEYRRGTFTLPDEVPVGEAAFVVTVESKTERPQAVDAELWARMLQQEAEVRSRRVASIGPSDCHDLAL